MSKYHQSKAWPMILLVTPLLYIVFANPFEEPILSIIEVLYLSVIFGITIVDAHRRRGSADEVELATTDFGIARGAVFGLTGAIVLLVATTKVPFLAQTISAFASDSRLPPIATGFVLGILTTLLLVAVSVCTVLALRIRWMMRQ